MLHQICSTASDLPCWALIPASYLIYRITRTVLALAEAIFVYWIAPLLYSPNLEPYRNRWTVVSGGTDGIGKAYMFELARRGLRKFLLVARNETKMQKVKAEMETQYPGSEVRTLLFDFNSAINEECANKLRDELANVNIGMAVDSVGVGRELLERFGDQPEADRQIFRVNAIGAAEFISAVLPPMERAGGGQLVVLSSSQAFRPIPLLAAYSACKSFLSFISEAVDREYATIRVQCLTPALVATNMTYYDVNNGGSLFVVTANNFAREAVGTLGLVRVTSGCFNHEIQMLLRHFFPWAILKHLIMPIYWLHQRRMIRLHGNGTKGDSDTNKSTATTITNNNNVITPPSSPSSRHSKIPTAIANGGGTIGNGMAAACGTCIRQRA